MDGFDLLKLTGHPDLGWTVKWHVMIEAELQGALQGGHSHEGVEAQDAASDEEGGAAVPRWRKQVCMLLSRKEDPSDSSNGDDDNDKKHD